MRIHFFTLVCVTMVKGRWPMAVNTGPSLSLLGVIGFLRVRESLMCTFCRMGSKPMTASGTLRTFLSRNIWLCVGLYVCRSPFRLVRSPVHWDPLFAKLRSYPLCQTTVLPPPHASYHFELCPYLPLNGSTHFRILVYL